MENVSLQNPKEPLFLRDRNLPMLTLRKHVDKTLKNHDITSYKTPKIKLGNTYKR